MRDRALSSIGWTPSGVASRTSEVQDLEGDEVLYREMKTRFGKYFEGSMGADAIQKRLETFDLEGEAAALREIIQTGKAAEDAGPQAAQGRLCVPHHEEFADRHGAGLRSGDPARPASDGAAGWWPVRHVDLNDLYRRVINRNNRLKRLLDLGARDHRQQREADAAGGRRLALRQRAARRPSILPGNRPLKSISDMLKGKQADSGRTCSASASTTPVAR